MSGMKDVAVSHNALTKQVHKDSLTQAKAPATKCQARKVNHLVWQFCQLTHLQFCIVL